MKRSFLFYKIKKQMIRCQNICEDFPKSTYWYCPVCDRYSPLYYIRNNVRRCECCHAPIIQVKKTKSLKINKKFEFICELRCLTWPTEPYLFCPFCVKYAPDYFVDSGGRRRCKCCGGSIRAVKRRKKKVE